LTGIRFVAAAVVVADHFAPRPFFSGADAGPAAVTLFFLLSGFVLTYTARPGRVRLREFYVARLARIYPAYLLGLVLAAALLPFGVYHPDQWCPAPAPALVPDLALVQSWVPEYTTCLDNPSWSLSCELFFYALFPLLLLLVRRVSTPRLGLTLAACWGGR
jgi:peptidoglycan/LPS O-acetylase OafA/YrhL